MKKITIRAGRESSISEAVYILKGVLKPGDIILTGPASKNSLIRFIDVTVLIVKHVLRGITHSCVYLGDERVLDIDYKPLDRSNEVEEKTLEGLIRSKIEFFGSIKIYVVSPKTYTRKQRKIVVQESMDRFIKNRKTLNHTYTGCLTLGMRYIFFRNKRYKEDMSFKKSWTCGEMVAYLLKKSGTEIGKRATYTFVPPMFIKSKYFKIKRKVCIE